MVFEQLNEAGSLGGRNRGRAKEEGRKNKRRGLLNRHLKDSRPSKLPCIKTIGWLRE